MNPISAVNIMSLIQIHYPNGLTGFRENNGNIFAFPKRDSYIICCDNLPEEISSKISSYCKDSKVKVAFFTEQNFQHETEDERNEWSRRFFQLLIQIGMNEAIIGVTLCTIYVQALEYQSDNKDVVKIMDFLQKSDEIVRAHIQFKDKMITLNKKRKPKEVKEIQPETNHPISDDDITNLKIDLHSIQYIEDFIKTLEQKV